MERRGGAYGVVGNTVDAFVRDFRDGKASGNFLFSVGACVGIESDGAEL